MDRRSTRSGHNASGDDDDALDIPNIRSSADDRGDDDGGGPSGACANASHQPLLAEP